ncbi:hypothetical protein [Paenibacillus flagellatus]|uniref:LysM domain-containing protein n=1 Tax=Paenibacillus flagellatus TaxID=2211139 RepID=A0A2V5K6K9_9BACL|nr:hypothetical protein [Paenibacillus flagellatus]PYI54452.1 hypothetical protein DLM86_13370 [Paenibacillus flagellatus]
MNGRHALKRLALGAVVLGVSGTIALSAPEAYAQAAPSEPAAPEAQRSSPGADPSAGERGEIKRHKRFFLFEDAAAVIGIDKDELKKQLKEGKSLAEIAKAKGIREDDLIDKLVAIRTQKIDEAVKAGKWPQEKADRIKQKLPDHLKTLVNRKDWKERKDDKPHRHPHPQETGADESSAE